MSRKVSKAALVRRIKALEEEIEAIHNFHQLSVVGLYITHAESLPYSDPHFVPVDKYAYRYCLYPDEIGYSNHLRYVLINPRSPSPKTRAKMKMSQRLRRKREKNNA